MNRYCVQYNLDGTWIPFYVLSDSIYEVEKWTKENVQPKGICITFMGEMC